MHYSRIFLLLFVKRDSDVILWFLLCILVCICIFVCVCECFILPLWRNKR